MQQNSVTLFDLNKYKKSKVLFDNIVSFEKELVLFGGAIKGGKTFGAVATCILICNTYANCRGVLVRKDMPLIEKNTLPTVKKLLPLAYGGELKAKRGYYVLSFKNGSEIILMGENYTSDKDFTKLLGFDLNFIIFEEINELQESFFDKALTRLGTNRHSCDIPPFMIATCNPSFGWVKKRMYDVMTSSKCPEKWLFIKSLPTDNPIYGEDQYRWWKENLNPYDYARWIKGLWTPPKEKGALLKNFDPVKHIGDTKIDSSKTLHFVFDNNVLPYISCAIWQIDVDKKEIRQINEIPFEAPDNLAKKAGEGVVKWLNKIGYSDPVYIYGDASGNNRSTADKYSFFGRIEKEIKRKYVVKNRVERSNPSVAMSAAFVNTLLEGSTEWTIIIDNKCEHSIRDYMGTLEAEDGGTKKVKIRVGDQTYEKNGHFTDCFRYFVTSVFKNMFIKFKKNII